MTAALALPELDELHSPTDAPSNDISRKDGGKPRLALSVRPAPRREPPFDDELAEPPYRNRYQQVLPLGRAKLEVFEPVVADPGLPDPSRWAQSLLVGVIETASGKRPLQQLASMFSLGVSHGLRRDFDKVARLGNVHWIAGTSVRSVRAMQPVEGVAEVSATLQRGARVRAVAMRLERHQGRWSCTRLQLG
jgi:hypothetical protein